MYTDAYGIGEIDRSKITQIYVDETGVHENLALLPYIQKLRLRLYDLGYSVTKEENTANFILRFEVETSEPIIKVVGSSYTIRGETRTIEKEGEGGKRETFTYTESDRSVPTTEEVVVYRKTMRIKLYQLKTKRLIWQVETYVEDRKTSAGNMAYMFVYEPLRYFLKTTPAHPTANFYNRRHQRIISELFHVQSYR